MPLVSRNSIESIKDRVNIYDVVSPYVALKKIGAYWRGLSPFTNENTPSFFVMPDKNIFKCFSTGNAGDVFRFIELKENLAFPDAVETLASRFNITLEYDKSNGTTGAQENHSLRTELFQIYELTVNYFHKAFMADNEIGHFIREYWKHKRKFSLNLAKEHKIGLAPIKGGTLIEGLLKKNFSINALKQSGLFYVKKDNNNPKMFVPRFRGRLMIPIRDVQGRTIAFAGRQLPITLETDPSHDAKYINSPETPIFSKSRALFGIHSARTHISDDKPVILVEGQLDALRCWDRGFEQAIAPQGTAITEQQLSIIRRYSPKLYCVLDGDNAGQKAAYRMLPMALKEGLEVAFFELAKGHDPDTFLLENGAEAFQEHLEKATSPIAFAVRHLLPKEFPTPQDKALALDQLFGIINQCDSAVVIEEYLEEAARLTKSNLQAVMQDFNSFENDNNKLKGSKSNEVIKKADNTKKKRNDKLTSVEYQTLLIILNHEDIAHSLATVINPEWITTSSIYATLLLRILAEFCESNWRGEHTIHQIVETDEEKNLIYSLMSEEVPFKEPVKAANLCVKTIFTNYINQSKHAIELQITQINDPQQIRELQKERIALRKALQDPPKLEIELTKTLL